MTTTLVQVLITTLPDAEAVTEEMIEGFVFGHLGGQDALKADGHPALSSVIVFGIEISEESGSGSGS